MKYRSLPALTSLLLVISACSPEPVFRLSPENGPSTFHKGAEYITLEDDGILVTIAYYRHLDNFFAMDVEILNQGTGPARIDPANFSRIAYKHYKNSELSDLISHHSAADPETKLLEIDKRISRKHASQKTDEAFYFTLQGLSLAAEIAGDSEYEEIEDDRQQSRIEQEIDRRNYRYELMGLEQKREIWELEALRITDLYPNDYVRGLLFFPHEPKAAGYKIILNIDGKKFESGYTQKKFKP